jgi:ankyrin repeat protein
MAVADPKLTIVELRQAVSTPAIGGTLDGGNIVQEYEIMKRCSSLIRKSTDGKYFEFAHFSVREFLEDEKAIFQTTGIEKYWITQSTTNSLLATQCLRFLQMENFDTMPDEPNEQVAATRERDESFPFYRHAALLWIKLTKDGLGDSEILGLAKSLFQPSKRAYFMCWAIEVFKKVTYATGTRSELSEIQAWRTVSIPSFQPLHMAAALNLPEICGFLICSASDVNQKLDAATPLDLAFMSVLAVPGLAEMSGKTKLHRDLMTTGRNEFLPSTQRRDMTVDCLMHAGARSSDHLIPPNTLSVFSITCLFASILNDLYPVFRCLCSRIIPSVSDVKVLQEWLVATDTSNHVAEGSTRMLLKFLSSTGAYNTDWGAELGMIVWNWALECDFSLTRDLSLIGSCALLSDDALVSQLVSAVCSDNVGLLKYCVKDRRLKNQVRYSGPVNGLLHLAVKHNAFDVFKALVTAGFDPYNNNDKGDLPIHLCERQGSLHPFKAFKDLGLSLISKDQNGYNILHYWAQDRPLNYEFVNGIFELDTEEAIKGLQTRTPHGDTPLTMVFESSGESPRNEHRDLDLNKLCLQVLGSLQRYRREKGISTDLGTGQSVYWLKEAFTEFDSMIRTDPTPLHKLKAWVSLDQVQLLTKVYPEALNSKVDGRLPVERYITNTLDSREFPNNNIIKALFPDSMNEYESSENQSLWNFACCLPDNDGAWKEQYTNSKEFETMIAIMFRRGAMRTHEEQFKESGLMPLISNYHASLMPTIRDAILQTNYWDGMQSSDAISLLFQDVIKSGNLDMIRLLAQNGADLHHRVNGQAPFDTAFQAHVAIDLCSTEEGSAVLRELLESCSDEKKVNDSPEADIVSPLHSLATSEDATNIIWLAEALVRRGFDIDFVGPGLSAETPLVYHLQQSSFRFAEKLLELGADPYADGDTSLNAVLACIVTDNLSFLRKILDQKTQTPTPFRWSDPVTFKIKHLYQTAVIKNGNALHLASACNSVVCLGFILDQVSELDKNSVSDDGLTPVHIAAYEGFVDAMKHLLERGFSTMAESRFGFTPMHMAVLGRSLLTVQCLLEYGASQTLDASGRTPGRISFELGFNEIYELLEGDARGGYQQISSVQELTEHVEPTERLAMSFERAMQEEDYESMRQLIDKGCPVDVSLPSRQGLSALLVALEEENLVMGEWLLQEGASPLQANDEGEVTIDIAAGQPNLNRLLPELFLEYLLEGGDLKFGYELPLHEAIDKGNTKGLEILLEIAEEHTHYIG